MVAFFKYIIFTSLRAEIEIYKHPALPWRRGIVDITSAYRTEDPGFESCQGVRLSGIFTLQCCCHKLTCIVILCRYLRNINP
jgi:hypothetical protein